MLMNAILTVSQVVFPLVTIPYVSRILHPSGVGKVYFATSFVSYFTMLAQIGIPVYGVLACAKVRNKREELSHIFQELFIINLSLSIILFVLYCFVISTIPKLLSERFLMFVMGLSIILNSINIDWLYQALEKYSFITLRSMIFKLISLIGMLTLIRGTQDYVLYGALTIFPLAASSVTNFAFLRNFVSFPPLKGIKIKNHIAKTSKFLILTVMTTVYTNLDLIMLGLIDGDRAAGCYGTAIKIKLGLVTLIISIIGVLFPRMSYLAGIGSKERFKTTLNKAVSLALSISLPLSIFFIICARESIMLIAGKEFNDAIMPMTIIMPTLVFIAMSNVMGMQALVPLDKENYTIAATTAGALINIPANLILIPVLGSSGAAISTLASEMLVFAVIAVCIYKDGMHIFAGNTLRYPFLSVAAAAAITVPIRFSALNRLGSVGVFGISALSFFTIYLLLMYAQGDPLTTEVILHRRRNK